MPRRRDGNKTYKSGDPIHIVVTQDFVDDANKFFSHCRQRGYNPSQVIRQAMMEWLKKEENGTGMPPGMGGTAANGDDSNNFDEKLMSLLTEKPISRPSRGMSLRTVKEILENAQ